MSALFRDRIHAGRLLAERLAKYARQSDVLVLALPRGGVPVAAEIAKALHAPLDVLVVRKLGAPGNPEFAIGAIASGGLQVVNARAVASLGLTEEEIDEAVALEEPELVRREQAYRRGREAPGVWHRTIILVDDGIATGSTMRAAVGALRQARAGRIIVAAPVAARESYLELRDAADEMAVLHMPKDFIAVGDFYQDFAQTTDGEVRTLLDEVEHPYPVG